MSATTIPPTEVKSTDQKLWTSVIIAWLIAGTADALAAIFILAKGHAAAVFKYVASGAYGKEAFSGGDAMVIRGVCFHYFIALSFTVFYFLIYPYISLFRKSLVTSAVIYGLFTWAVMSLVVVPMTLIQAKPFNPASALLNAVILMFTIGLPVNLMRRRYDTQK